jgi:flagellar M-ring protein FliF
MRTAVIGLCGVLLVLFVLRPVASQVTATLRGPLLLASETEVPGVLEERAMVPTQNDPDEEVFLPRAKSKAHQLHQGIFEQVSEHIRREPAQSTRLLEAWIGSSEEKS